MNSHQVVKNVAELHGDVQQESVVTVEESQPNFIFINGVGYDMNEVDLLDEHGNPLSLEALNENGILVGDNVGQEVEVEELVEDLDPTNEPSSSKRKTPVRQETTTSRNKALAPPQIMKTSSSLKGTPKLFSRAGTIGAVSKGVREKRTEDIVEDKDSIRLNHETLPGIRDQLKVVSSSVLLKSGFELRIKEEVDVEHDVVVEEEEVDVTMNNGQITNDPQQHSSHYLNIIANLTNQLMPPRQTCVENSEADEGMPQAVSSVSNDTNERVPITRKQIMHTFNRWPLYWDRPVDFQEACDILMNVQPVPSSKVCRDVPQNFCHEGTFVVDLRGLESRHDVGHDSLGYWSRPSGRVRYYSLAADGASLCRADDGKGHLLPGQSYHYKCMLKRYELQSTVKAGGGRYVRKIFTALLPPEKNSAVGMAVVTYEWCGGPPVPIGEQVEQCGSMTSKPKQKSRFTSHENWERLSFRDSQTSGPLPSVCSAYFGEWPLYAVGAIDFNVAASIILGGTIVAKHRLCNRVPQEYRDSGTFVIDLSHVICDGELRRDDNGLWGKPAGHSRYYKIDPSSGDAVRVDKANKLIEGAEYDVQILMKRYENTHVNHRFCRKIYTGRNSAGLRAHGLCMNLAVIVYYWKGDPEPFYPTHVQRRVRVDEELLMRNTMAVQEPAEEYLGYMESNNDRLMELSREIPSENGMPVLAPGAPQAGTSASTFVPVGTPKRRKLAVPPLSTTDGWPSERDLQNMDETEIETIRSRFLEKELQNQDRLTNLLQRASNLLERLDESTAGVVHQQFVQENVEEEYWDGPADASGNVVGTVDDGQSFAEPYIMEEEIV